MTEIDFTKKSIIFGFKPSRLQNHYFPSGGAPGVIINIDEIMIPNWSFDSLRDFKDWLYEEFYDLADGKYFIQCVSKEIPYWKRNAKRPNYKVDLITLIVFEIQHGVFRLREINKRTGRKFPLYKIIKGNDWMQKTVNLLDNDDYAYYCSQPQELHRQVLKQFAIKYGVLERPVRSQY